MYCINCGHNQGEGKFCANCGTVLGNDVAEYVQTKGRAAAKAESKQSDYFEKVKVLAKMYWGYFLNYLKHPTEVFKQGEKEFANGLTTIVMLAIFIGLAIFSLLKGTTSSLHAAYGPSLFAAMGYSFVYVLISAAIVIGSLLLTIKFLGPDQSLRSIIGIYGTHLIPSTFLVLVALILLIIKAHVIGYLLLSFTLLFALIIVPLYMLIKLLTQEATTLDPLYSVLVYLVVFAIIYGIFLGVLGDSLLSGMMSRLKF